MALVSEFLGQLTLSYGGVSLTDVHRVDEQTVIDVLTRRSYEQRRDIAFEYERIAKKDLNVALKAALSGPLEALVLGLMKSTAQFDASELKASMKVLRKMITLSVSLQSKGAKEKVVTRIMVSRCEVDLMKIRTEFRRQHKRSLYQTIAEHTKGDYQKALLSLCGGDD
ncbi:annexin A2-like [Etheostoma cragini]|uniref:annexin A2-like n=1 Tax=Etheostoma cragini TaxID=417921 RepID=UPI00155F3234|nr:annexin A2-like [Etheostoma cragini]